MIKFDSCIRCGSKNMDKLKVNTQISLNYPEQKNPYTGSVSQTIIYPKEALVCRDCGHTEFFSITREEAAP